MTGETAEVRSDKRKPREKREEKREKRVKKRKKEEEKRKKREKERNRENKRKGEKKISRANYYQSTFNSQKEKLNILAVMLKISKSGCRGRIIDHHHYKSSCRS